VKLEDANCLTAASIEEDGGTRIHADLLFVGRASDVPVGAAIRVEVAEFVLAVFNLNGSIFVTDDACTHGPGSLSEGFIEDDIVECNFHRGAFNVRTGEAVSPPCMVPVRTYAVVVSQGSVYIDPHRPRSS
jgi:nitrite reductase/ring-hydroxylating ferredoxin subunit